MRDSDSVCRASACSSQIANRGSLCPFSFSVWCQWFLFLGKAIPIPLSSTDKQRHGNPPRKMTSVPASSITRDRGAFGLGLGLEANEFFSLGLTIGMLTSVR